MKIKLCGCGCGKPAPIANHSDKRFGVIKGQPRKFIHGHNKGRVKIQLEGQRFGLLTVIHEVPNTKPYPQHAWHCQCDCGGTRVAYTSGLRTGRSQSCGCLKSAAMSGSKNPAFKHGFDRQNARTPEYRAYLNAKGRCVHPHNISYPYYGGRGIKFLYPSFVEFIQDLGLRPSPNHSLDRINNDGNYELGNCQWATGKEQVFNRRVKRIEHFSDEQLQQELERRNLKP